MYLENKYTTWYNNIILSARARVNQVGYVEKHHIIPKSLGGANSKENIVQLTAKEHFICHRLLCKMTTGKAKQKMILACKMLTRLKTKIIITGKTFESIRIAANEVHRATFLGKPSPLKGKPGKMHTEESKNKIRKSRSLQVLTEDTRKKISKSLQGRTLAEETKEKMRKPKAESAVKKSREIWTRLSNREIVFECRNLAKSRNISLGRGWARKSDAWILDKIQELKTFS